MFKKAVKHESKLRLAIAGPSGSGKTYSALRIGTALGKTAVIDTESGSASKYADVFDFDVLEMEAPFSPQKYIAAIKAASDAGYDVVVVDSLTHAWNGTGGVLEIVDQAAKAMKNSNTYMAWKSGTPHQNALIEAIVTSKLHVIGTMRSKTEYALMTDNRGKVVPQKIGMAPIQRDGFEYEFDVMFDMDIENNGIVTKSRCPELTGQVIPTPGEDVAEILKRWLSGAPDDRLRYADGSLVDGAALEFFNQYQDAEGEAPESADSLREWYKAQKASKAKKKSPAEQILAEIDQKELVHYAEGGLPAYE